MRLKRYTTVVCLLAAVVFLGGCWTWPPPRKDAEDLHYLGREHDGYYKGIAESLDYPLVDDERPEQIAATSEPHSLFNRSKDQVWDMTLLQAIQIGLANNKIIRTAGSFDAPLNALVTNPNGQESVWDPALQETGVLLGSLGVEGALSQFDTTFTASLIDGYSNVAVNNQVLSGGVGQFDELQTNTGVWNASLTKTFANGGQLTLSNVWNYTNNTAFFNGQNAAGVSLGNFNSYYTGYVRAGYTQPLWAGSGVEFTEIASPIGNQLAGVSGVNQGVVIARINNDVSLTSFELSSLNLLRDIETTYWNLYLQYRLYHAAVVAHNSALRSWREANAKLIIGGVTGFTPTDEAQARDTLFADRATAEQDLTNLYTAETDFRRLLALPVNDGRIIRPVDEPSTAKFVPNWYNTLTDALTRRPELTQQKFQIKSLELQLKAARSLVNPTLNFTGYYQVNAYGNELISQNPNIFQPGSSAFGSLSDANQTGWNLGFVFSMPIGFRAARAQVRNYEIRVAKAHEGLAVVEMDIAQELAVAFQNVSAAYFTAQSNFNRRIAAEREVELYEYQYEVGTTTLAFVLQAQASLASAESNYYTSLTNYAEAIADLNYRQGTLLDYYNVSLAESPWTPEAYKDAQRRSWARAHAIPAPWLCTEPAEFVVPMEGAVQEHANELHAAGIGVGPAGPENGVPPAPTIPLTPEPGAPAKPSTPSTPSPIPMAAQPAPQGQPTMPPTTSAPGASPPATSSSPTPELAPLPNLSPDPAR